MDVLQVKGVSIGKGAPKTIVSLMDATAQELSESARRAVAAGADCLEWRADFFVGEGASVDAQIAEVAEVGAALRAELPSTPLVFTLRSEGQGGRCTLGPEAQVGVLAAAIAEGAADLVDVELALGDERVGTLVEAAHRLGLCAIVSQHDFERTPAVNEMVSTLTHMSELGADVPKLAVMAQDAADAARLMQATSEVCDALGKPLLTMAMGAEGAITRLAGESFGSALTFCALGRASAPGQVELAQARAAISALHAALVPTPRGAHFATPKSQQ